MTSERIVGALRAEPFCPFRVWLADGQALDVRHPEQVTAVAGDRVAVISSASAVARRTLAVDLLLVVALEYSSGTEPDLRRSTHAG